MQLSTYLRDNMDPKMLPMSTYLHKHSLHLTECKFVNLILYGVHENNTE